MANKHRRKHRKRQARINASFKRALIKKDVFMAPCYYCKFVFLMDDLTVEHIHPLSLGGGNTPDNMTLACGPCNHQKGREAWFSKKKISRDKYEKQYSVEHYG